MTRQRKIIIGLFLSSCGGWMVDAFLLPAEPAPSLEGAAADEAADRSAAPASATSPRASAGVDEGVARRTDLAERLSALASSLRGPIVDGFAMPATWRPPEPKAPVAVAKAPEKAPEAPREPEPVVTSLMSGALVRGYLGGGGGGAGSGGGSEGASATPVTVRINESIGPWKLIRVTPEGARFEHQKTKRLIVVSPARAG